MDVLSTLLPWLAASAPLLLSLAAVAPRPWRVAPAVVGWGLAAGASLTVAAASGTTAPAAALVAGWGATTVRLDLPTGLVLTMVHLVGFAVVRFSRTALRDDPGGTAHVRALCAALAGVGVFTLTDHLLVAVAAWALLGQAVHALLTQGGRPGALRAAREKWVLGRLSELVLLAGVAFAAAEGAPLTMSALAREAPGSPAATVVALAAAVAVVLRTAVVPFHGWLVRVMEAPTPVSALLHAGVVNLGALLLLRLAPLVDGVPAARWLLLGVGVATAVVGGLVASVRPSVKSALAWSTVAQMGFVLVEAGLSAWSLVLLHLLAHSCYKAHAFLTAGSAVELAAARRFEPPPAPRTGSAGLAALGLALSAAGLAVAAGVPSAALPGALLVLAAAPSGSRGWGAALVVACAWVGWSIVFDGLVGAPHVEPDPVSVGVVLAGFAAGFGVSLARELRPDGPFGRASQPALLAGLWLDRPVSLAVGALPARPPSLRPLALHPEVRP
jgi:NAD(P)H-quinone oxidoreductase subunit 5